MLRLNHAIFILLLLLIATPCMAAGTSVTTHLDNSNATPMTVWAAAAILGLALPLYTLRSRMSTADLEADAIISVAAWVPIGFTAWTSFAVDRIVSSFAVADSSGVYTILENHIIYHFDVIGFAYGAGFLLAIVNTARIISLHKSLKLQSETTP